MTSPMEQRASYAREVVLGAVSKKFEAIPRAHERQRVCYRHDSRQRVVKKLRTAANKVLTTGRMCQGNIERYGTPHPP